MPPTQDPDDAFLGPKISIKPSPRPAKDLKTIGKYVTLQGLSDEDVPNLWSNLGMPNNSSVFNYLPMLRHSNPVDFGQTLQGLRDHHGMVLYAIKADTICLSPSKKHSFSIPKSHTETLGLVAFLDIQPEHRALEIGAVLYGPALRRTAAATEAQYLLLKYAFGQAETPVVPAYRRVVWKCNQLNLTSRRAAERLGFVYEGTFRKHMIMCERSRDSEWFSILDDEWDGFVRAGLEMWLDAENFDANGKQIKNLEACREICRIRALANTQ
jgi:RimJ/RimL family protein N-acetyltransferase